ncbi:MAG: PAS domain S-box protein, partial [Chloroflexota bacterium]
DGRCIFQTPQSVILRGKLLGTTIDDMDVPSEVREQWRHSNARVMAGETFQRDVSYMFNGEERHFFAVTTPVTDNKTKLGIMGINVDITERVQAQKALQKTEESSRMFLERLKALQDITIELARIEDFDDFCYKVVEFGRNRLMFERMGLWLVDPEDSEFTFGTFGTAEDGTIRDERQVHTATAIVLPQLTDMVEIGNKKIHYKPESELLNEYSQSVGQGWSAMGHLFDGDRIIGGLSIDNYFSHAPVQTYQLEILALYSNMVGHLCILKRAETKLHASEARFRSVFTSANVGITLANAKGYIVSVNPAFEQLLGYTQAEYQKMTIGDVTHPDDLEGTTSYFQDLLAGKLDFYQLEKRYLRKSGEAVWVRLNVSPFRGEGEARAIATVEDISARKQVEAEIQRINASLEQRVLDRTAELQIANERLTELDRLKTKFIADVTHELRTPLTVLATRVYLLQHSPPEKHPAYLMALKEQLERLANFVNATLDLSRLELGHDRIAFGQVDLNNVVQQVVMALEPRAEIAGLQITFQAAPTPEVRGEFNQLAQVVTNLVANAINYTSNGSIIVRTSFDETQKQVCLEVTDTGMGISEGDIPHLFTRFYRGERAGQTNIPGTGLGLSIVKEIVDLHEGSIVVQSQVGRGTTFKIYLPIYAKP